MEQRGVTEREFGRLEQKVEELPTHGDLRAIILEVRQTLERQESKTEKLVENVSTKTVESAFKLQWSEIEKYLNANAPPKRDWLPYIMALGVIVLAGAQEAIPFLTRMLTGT